MEQELDAQHDKLRAVGCAPIFEEKISGARADNRPALKNLLASLTEGDLVIVTRLDRLARSTIDLFQIVKSISDAKANLRSLAEPWADTTTAEGRLMFTILSALAEFERELILARTKEGRERAIAKGKKMGRPFRLTSVQRIEARQRRTDGASYQELADSYNVGVGTIWRACNDEEAA